VYYFLLFVFGTILNTIQLPDISFIQLTFGACFDRYKLNLYECVKRYKHREFVFHVVIKLNAWRVKHLNFQYNNNMLWMCMCILHVQRSR
jgi:hypothetical protein